MENFKTKKTGILVVSMLVLFLALGIIYVQNINKLLTNNAMLQLKEVSIQGAERIGTQHMKDLDILKTISEAITIDPEMSEEEKMNFLKKKADELNYFRLALVDSQGNAKSSDDATFSVSDRDFFKSAISGNNAISKPVVDKVKGKDRGIVLATPLKEKNTITGILFGGFEVGKLVQMLDVSFYNGTGIAYVVDSSGEIILHPDDHMYGQNIFTIMSEGTDKETQNKIKQAFEKDESGVTLLASNEGPMYFSYASINSVNDWYMVASIPKTAVSMYSNGILMNTFWAIGFFLVIIVLGVLYFSVVNRKNRKKIYDLAYYDGLTGMPNYEKFCADSTELINRFGAEGYAVISMDIRRFKYLNKEFGYDMGDRLLRHIGQHITEITAKNETCCRVSSDKFAGMIKKENVEVKIHQVIEAIFKNEDIRKLGYPLKCKYGVYILQQGDTDIHDAIDNANVARELMRDNYNEDILFYNASMQARQEKEKEIERTMYKALENGEFVPFFQPKYSLMDGKIVGAEALVRWKHPQKGLISPGEFISIFEKNGFIADLDFYMLAQTCRVIKELLKEGITPVTVSVNQSRYYMYSASYVERVAAVIKEAGIDTKYVELEITESAVYENVDELLEVINKLHNLGFKLSIDDFGSGYSSLNILRKMEVDTLKIDRLFLDEITKSDRGRKVISNVIHMAKELCMKTVAEGVETKEQIEFLKCVHCDIAQGFYYSRPVEEEVFKAMLRKQ